MTPIPMNENSMQIAWPDLPLGFGTSRLCSLNGGLPIRRAAALLSAAFELGVRFVDTAPTYGQGHAESAIGELVAHVREQLFICSKVGYSFGRKAQLINAAKPLVRPLLPWMSGLRRMIASARDGVGRDNNLRLTIEPPAIRSVLEGTLRRIRRDHLDLLLLHDPSVESVDNESNQAELRKLAQEGKIRAWGVSTGDAAVVDSALRAEGCAVIQFPVFQGVLRANRDVIGKCAAHGMAIIANSVLMELSHRRHAVGQSNEHSTLTECLAFALSRPGVRIVLCGTRNLAHLRQNVEIVRNLSPQVFSNDSQNATKPVSKAEPAAATQF